MPAMFEQLNLTLQAVQAQGQGHVQQNGPLYGRARLRCMAVREATGWRIATCTARVFQPGREPPEHPGHCYPGVLLAERWLSVVDLIEQVGRLGHGLPLVFGDCEVAMEAATAPWSSEFMPSDDGFSSGRRFLLSGGNVRVPHEPLLHFHQPFVRPPLAVKEWCELAGPFTNLASRAGTFAVFFPEFRAGFTSTWRPEGLEVVVRSTVDHELRLKGAWRRGDHWHGDVLQAVDCTAPPGTLLLPAPDEAEWVELYLLGPATEVFDALAPTRCRHGEPVSSAQQTLEAFVTQATSAGENEVVEFKPFVDPDDPKMGELKATTVAFANTHGGTILLGVHRSTTIEGIDAGLCRWARSGVTEEAMARYAGTVRQALMDGIQPTVQVTTAYVKIDGKTILLVNVPHGADPPYCRSQNGPCLVRAGASSRNALPAELLALRPAQRFDMRL